MIDATDQRVNTTAKGAVVGITASSAALVVAQQEADFAVVSDHLAGARVSICFLHPPVQHLAVLLLYPCTQIMQECCSSHVL